MSESPYAAPCVFCRYNGPNYYQAESHERHCPWWEVGGLDERAKLFRSKLVAKLEAAEKMARALGDLLLSADCAWYANGGGHDWRESVDKAEACLAAWDSAHSEKEE